MVSVSLTPPRAVICFQVDVTKYFAKLPCISHTILITSTKSDRILKTGKVTSFDPSYAPFGYERRSVEGATEINRMINTVPHRTSGQSNFESGEDRFDAFST